MNWFTRLFKKPEEFDLQNIDRQRRDSLEDEKAKATKKGEPWVAVIDTKVNPNDIRNGFFELDWNNEFIEQLLDAGYHGESQEEIVDSWFKNIVRQMLEEEQLDISRGAGNVNLALGKKFQDK